MHAKRGFTRPDNKQTLRGLRRTVARFVERLAAKRGKREDDIVCVTVSVAGTVIVMDSVGNVETFEQ